MSNVATHKRWKDVGSKLHARIRRAYPRRYQRPGHLAAPLHDFKRLELYKDMGYDSFDRYLKVQWGPWWKRLRAWSRLGDVVERVPDFFKLCAPGYVSLEKVSRAANLIDTKEDALWWGRLSRLASLEEYRCIVAAAETARKVGHAAPEAVLLVGYVDKETFAQVVAPAIQAARASLDSCTQLGDALAWICATCIGKSLPGPLGGIAPHSWDAEDTDAEGRERAARKRARREKGHAARVGGGAYLEVEDGEGGDS